MKILRSISTLLQVLLIAGGAVLSIAQPAHAGSPFYLTAERSFANTEKPAIRLDFTDSSQPMLVRVLRPKNLERFLDGQLHISRSYEQPVSELNPGHYFVKGLNRLESPLKSFRNMLDSDFRASFADTPMHEAILDTTPDQVASVPEEILIAPPSGLDVVREYTVDLQFGGSAPEDLGWWFANNTWSEDEYQLRTITLDPQSDGLYLVQAVQGKAEAQCLLQVSSLSVQVKQSSRQLVIRVIDRNLAPVADAAIHFRDGRGKWLDVGKRTDAFGEVRFDNPEGILDGKLVVRAETQDGRMAFVDTDFIPSVASDDSVFIVTDRPIFKPGETFYYKGVIRAFAKGGLTVPRFGARQARVTLLSADGKPAGQEALTPLTGSGSFSGSFRLDDSQEPGLYRLIAEIGGKPYGGDFRVRDYVKPVYYLELAKRSPTVVSGEKFTGSFKARRYSGGIPKDLRYEVFLYRKKFEAPQWVTEAGAGLAAGMDYYGEVRSTSALTEPKRVYSSVEERMTAQGDPGASNSWASAAKVDDEGVGNFSFVVPKGNGAEDEEWIYTLMIRALDPSGAQAVLTENIYVTLAEAQPLVRFSAPMAEAGEKKMQAVIRSTYADGKPAPNAGGFLELTLQQAGAAPRPFAKLPFTTDQRGGCRLAIPELTGRGKLIGLATLDVLGNKRMRHGSQSLPAVLIVGGAKGEEIIRSPEIELYASQTILSPGEKAKVLALLPDGWGKGESGPLWETISGREIHETRQTEVKGKSWWMEVEAKPEYGTGFYDTVTVPVKGGKYREQTLGFRIVPVAKRLNIAVRPEREETDPLRPFTVSFTVADQEGKPAADTELTVTVVDRAVYAVQQELRPGIFDFFYPLPRQNLSTFYSDELQGYGYADILKKPNFRLGALKSQSKPTKKSMRDTAGWFPHVMTDGQGRAAVVVDIPANITEWLITAIAADKTGRVGEAKATFRTVADVNVELVAPQFLREKEEVVAQVKTISHLKQPVHLHSAMTMLGGAGLGQPRVEKKVSLLGEGEDLQAARITAATGAGVATLKVLLEPQEKIHVAGLEEFDIPIKPAAMRQVLPGVWQDNRLVTPVQETAAVREAKITVDSGLLGAALNAAAVLVSYPYGCTEQLVHSTIPNLVLMDLVRRAGIKEDELGPLAELLVKAEKNAGIGIKRIIQNQKSSGGFSLWPSDPEPSLAVTLTALRALKFAWDLEVPGAGRAYRKGVEWFGWAKPPRLDQHSALYGFELAGLAECGAGSEPWDEQIQFIESLAANDRVPVRDLVDGLRIFNAYKDASWNRFGQHFKDDQVKRLLVARLIEAIRRFHLPDYLNAVRQDTVQYEALGFSFGVPSLLSSALGILAEMDALDEQTEMMLKMALMMTMKNGYWISTYDTAQVIFNSRPIFVKEAKKYAGQQAANSRHIVAKAKDGVVIGELHRIPAGFTGVFKNPGVSTPLTEIFLEGLKDGDVPRSALTVEVPFGDVPVRAHGLEVERRLLKITAKGAEPLNLNTLLHKGDLVVSEIHVRRGGASDVQAMPSRFVVIEDGVPSFAQAIDDDHAYLADAKIQPDEDNYWRSVKATHRYPERTVRIATLRQDGEVRTYQVWQVGFAGKAQIPPAAAFDMYDESIQGNSGAVSVAAE